MGYSIAEELALQGAQVILVSGPTNLEIKNPAISIVSVMSADEMYKESVKVFNSCQAAILSAAVADFTPEVYNATKIKSEDKTKNLSLQLKPTKDIAFELGKIKRADQKLIGFALETNNEEFNASKKLMTKNFDFIVLNSLKDKGAGFGFDTNKVAILYKDNKRKYFELKPKKQVAIDIVNEIENLF